jgi:MFS family permease
MWGQGGFSTIGHSFQSEHNYDNSYKTENLILLAQIHYLIPDRRLQAGVLVSLEKNYMYTDENKRMFFFLIVLAIICAAGFQGWHTLLNNFAVEVVGVTGRKMGMIQGVREIPGFLSLLVIYLLLIIREHRLAALSLVLMGAGISLTGILSSYFGLVMTTLIMSFGFHYYQTLNQSLTLQYFSTTQAPLMLGRMRALAAAANLTVGALVFGLSYLMDYARIFTVIGLAVTAAALWCMLYDPTSKHVVPQRKRMILRTKYWLYYILQLLAGARRQVFVAFAVFLLVQKFKFTIREITVLFFLNNIINYFLSPLIARAINRYGERKVLSLEYFALIIVFIVYAYTDSKAVVAVMYILDFIFFNFSMAIQSFFQKIADPRDIAPSMAVGFTINHIVAVIVPVIGGMVWMVDYKIPFFGGAVLSACSLMLVQFIRTDKPG